MKTFLFKELREMKNDIKNTKLLGADAIEAVVVRNGN